MLPAIRGSIRARPLRFGLAVGLAITGASASVSILPACITTAPPDLPSLPLRGPRILADSVQPAANEYLTALPPDGGFVVPVEVSDPTKAIVGRPFVDFYPGVGNNLISGVGRTVTQFPALDGGPTDVYFTIGPQLLGDPTLCHTIQFFVADGFNDSLGSQTSIDDLGADSVTWFYTPNGPGGCGVYDAGVYPDAGSDGSAIPPPPVN
ncbi:MAG TPA: hypothetical protein VHV30_02405 [Polyangiaceae bacterium]|jgi:hypothetical protein|nr:hypothetical protein [Polyangiaceae bacterium]